MTTCSKCGATNHEGSFCGQCGAPLGSTSPSPPASAPVTPPPPVYGGQAPPQPPVYGGQAPPRPPAPVGQPPVYGGQMPPQPMGQPPGYGGQMPPQPMGQPPGYGGQMPPQPMGQPPGYGGPAPQQPWSGPPRKSGSKVGVWIGGLVLVAVLGVGALLALTPDDTPVEKPTNQPAQNNPTPPAQPTETTQTTQTTQPNPPAKPTQPTQPSQPAQPAANNVGAKVISQGQIDVSFQAFDWHSEGMVSLASGDGTNVQLDLFDYVDGKFQPAFELQFPMGALNDVAFGDLFNTGEYQAILIAEKGLLLVDSDGEEHVVDGNGIRRVYVGDWDGDGQQETAIFRVNDDKAAAGVYRFFADKETEQVGTWDVNEFPDWPAQTFLTVNKRRILLGVNNVDDNNKEVVLYTIDPLKGLERNRAQKVASPWSSPLVGAGAAILGEKPTVVLSYQGSPSYLEFFDISQNGLTSRGKVMLPDGDAYYPIIGFYSGATLEILAITPQGKWVLYGY